MDLNNICLPNKEDLINNLRQLAKSLYSKREFNKYFSNLERQWEYTLNSLFFPKFNFLTDMEVTVQEDDLIEVLSLLTNKELKQLKQDLLFSTSSMKVTTIEALFSEHEISRRDAIYFIGRAIKNNIIKETQKGDT